MGPERRSTVPSELFIRSFFGSTLPAFSCLCGLVSITHLSAAWRRAQTTAAWQQSAKRQIGCLISTEKRRERRRRPICSLAVRDRRRHRRTRRHAIKIRRNNDKRSEFLRVSTNRLVELSSLLSNKFERMYTIYPTDMEHAKNRSESVR